MWWTVYKGVIKMSGLCILVDNYLLAIFAQFFISLNQLMSLKESNNKSSNMLSITKVQATGLLNYSFIY